MPKLNSRLPKYRLHKASGQAVVTLSGTDHYLGVHGSDTSRTAYNRKVSEWLTSHRLSPVAQRSGVPNDLTIDEIFVRYWAFVITYYVRNGEPTGEQHAIHSALTPLVHLYGPTVAGDFGPVQLNSTFANFSACVGQCRAELPDFLHRRDFWNTAGKTGSSSNSTDGRKSP